MKQVTIEISDEDYRDLIAHLAKRQYGRPLVAVRKLIEPKPWVAIILEERRQEAEATA